jgi:pyruvate/2-oxoglutarate dehydrogenase complex dihydrolipoamide acyltransferase (E2) component
MPTKVIMPQLGESVVEGTVSKWLKQEGEPIQEMDSLLEVNTDKVDTEIPSPAGGTLLKILVPEGETVRAGTIIAWIGQPDEAVPEDYGQGYAQSPVQAKAQGKEPAPVVDETGARASAEAVKEINQPTQPVPASQSGNGQRSKSVPSAGQAVTVPTPGRDRELGFISPIVARLAQENNIDLSRVSGSGEGGRITKKDVLAYIDQSAHTKQAEAEATPAPWETPGEGDLFRPTEMVFGPSRPTGQTEKVKTAQKTAPLSPEAPAPGAPSTPPVEVSLPGEGHVISLSPIRRAIAERMLASKRTSPHVTTVMEADMHRVVSHYNENKQAYARDGVKLTYTAYFAAATVQALRAFPMVNSSWTDAGINLHPRINLGLAVSLGEEGLIVPVLKGAEALSLLGMARAIADLAARARDHRLQPQDVHDGTFTITNHGISGSLFATPIINQPQCAILGVGVIQKRVVVIEDAAGGDTIAIRPMVYLSLTFDHRILDGASADGFLANIVQTLEIW